MTRRGKTQGEVPGNANETTTESRIRERIEAPATIEERGIYVCRLPIGVLSIRRHRRERTRVELWFENECLGSFDSAATAAEHVRERVTGNVAVDEYDRTLPGELSDWMWVSGGIR